VSLKAERHAIASSSPQTPPRKKVAYAWKIEGVTEEEGGGFLHLSLGGVRRSALYHPSARKAHYPRKSRLLRKKAPDLCKGVASPAKEKGTALL